MNDLTQEEIIKIKNYLNSELKESFPYFKLIEINEKTNPDLPDEVKDIIKQQKNNEKYHYICFNKNKVELSKIIFSNNMHHLIYEPYCYRFTYFDNNFNYIAHFSKSLLGKSVVKVSIQGKNFENLISELEDFKLKFSTTQFKQISLFINKESSNIFKISASGKDRIKSVEFNYKKNQIKASIVNCFIKNILFDLEGNIKSIGIQNKLSKELTLNKNQFDVSNYSQLTTLIEQELKMYNLITDKKLDIEQYVFDYQINFIKKLIEQKEKINNKIIYNHINNIEKHLFDMDISLHTINSPSLTINKTINNTQYEKYDGDKFDSLYYWANSILEFISCLNLKNIDLDYFLDPIILESLNELNLISNNFKDSFKIDIKNKKTKNNLI